MKSMKVKKVNAVKLLTNPEDDKKPEYSKPIEYWLYEKSGVVYDVELHYAIGKIAKDDDGIPIKLDADTYIIDYLIPIPIIEN